MIKEAVEIVRKVRDFKEVVQAAEQATIKTADNLRVNGVVLERLKTKP